MEGAIALITAGLLTLFDLDRTFYVPQSVGRKITLYLWWWSFVLANGLIALAVDVGVRAQIDMQPALRGLASGLGFLAVIRIKFTTFAVAGQDVPIGIEAFYEQAKQFVFKRINQIAKEARQAETIAKASAESLATLATDAKLSINQDAVMSPEQKREAKAWVISVLQDQASSEDDKRRSLADYILSGRR